MSRIYWDSENLIEHSKEVSRSFPLSMSYYKGPVSGLHKIGFDLDGVIATEAGPLSSEKEFAESFKVAKHLFKDLKRIKYIITGRPANTCPQTLEWLDKYVIHDEIFFNIHNAKFENHDKFKINVIKKVGIQLFVESDIKQAISISTACPCICFTNKKLYVNKEESTYFETSASSFTTDKRILKSF